MSVRKSPAPRVSRALLVTLYAVIGAVCIYVLPNPVLVDYDATHTSLWACATAASMALVFFKEPR
jgi:hypothetical protein